MGKAIQKFNAVSLALFAALACVTGEVFAQAATGPDMTGLTSNINWATVVTGILATGAAGLLVILAWKGVSMIYKVVKGA